VLYLIPWLINFLPEPGGTEALIFFQEIYLVFGVMGSFWPAAVLFPKSFLGRRISNRVGLPADRFLNLLIAGIVAAHDKVCPILNVEDRDE
jgi:hypothetical protein